MAIRVSETLYFVRDMDAAIRHYTEVLGFKLIEKDEWGFAVLDVDGTSKLGLILETAWEREFPDEDELPTPRLAIQTDDFAGEVHRLKALGVPFNTIRGEKGQRQSVTFYDHDENMIYLWSDPVETME
jgi:catechol 2,3-dioxygenase-like lactoylglutathione lyase family enzyme